MDNVLQIVIFAVTLTTYFTFVWGEWGAFRKNKGSTPLDLRVLEVAGALGVGIVVWKLWFALELDGAGGSLALATYACSLGLFWWAVGATQSQPLGRAFSSEMPKQLNTGGPFRWVRHPFYTAYLGSLLAGVLSARHPVCVVVFAVVGVLYFRAARLEEKKFLKSKSAKAYREYSAVTGMFFPKFITAKDTFHAMLPKKTARKAKARRRKAA